jgi:hypothetical protein
MTLYPDSYGTRLVSFEQMVAKHGPKAHPEFARRLWAWLETEGGRLGVGGGWRAPDTQPERPGFAPEGKSFHQDQRFASGIVAYAAVDLVHVDPPRAHRSPTWAETESAKAFGLHTFVTGEPWHIQCVEMRGWQSWVNAGRPDPPHRTLPGDLVPIPPADPIGDSEMIALDYKPGTPEWTALLWTGTHLSHVVNGHADGVLRRVTVPRAVVSDVELDGIIASSTTTTQCPAGWVNTPRGALWTSQRAG